ncbi:unnamed protein product [Ilex paraguariensis]|uniref:RNase III domain-containing protein n=1 Tax=Ilex paraguariensis TaxID=185542 RepID=A0ABC8TYC5_9AQUA
MAVALPLRSLSVRASSWDTQQRLSYNPHRTAHKKPQNHNTLSPTTTTTATTTTPSVSPLTTSTNRRDLSVSELLKRRNQNRTQVNLDESYLGDERWLPSPPKVEKPRSMYNAASLAYIGDCIYELFARRHFLFPPLNIEEYNDRVMAVVRCEAQDAMLQELTNDNYLTEEERDVLRWGKNSSSAKTRAKKRAGVAIYNRASSLETLVGYLYLTDAKRLEEMMLKLGFSAGESNQLILERLNKNLTKSNI